MTYVIYFSMWDSIFHIEKFFCTAALYFSPIQQQQDACHLSTSGMMPKHTNFKNQRLISSLLPLFYPFSSVHLWTQRETPFRSHLQAPGDIAWVLFFAWPWACRLLAATSHCPNLCRWLCPFFYWLGCASVSVAWRWRGGSKNPLMNHPWVCKPKNWFF